MTDNRDDGRIDETSADETGAGETRADDAVGPLDDEERLPWLEAVEEDDSRSGPSAMKLIASVLIGLVAIGLIVGSLFWMGSRDGEERRDAELIAAPEGDYKVKPDEPGGMRVPGEGGTASAASMGDDPNGSIDTNAMAEAPVTRQTPPVRQVEAPAKAPAPTPAATPVPAATPAPASGGDTIQLGAFSSQASANNAWKALSGRFAYLAPLSHSVMATQSGGKTLYRLRASGPGASALCGRLRVAGESCVQID